MKAGKSIYIVLIGLFLVFMVALEYSMPKKFTWSPTFSRYDHQPFGCAVFDDMLQVSLSGNSAGNSVPGYSVSDKTLYLLSLDSLADYSLLVVADRLSLTETDREALLNILDQGRKVMIVANDFDNELQDTLHFNNAYGYFYFSSFKEYVAGTQERDTLVWSADTVYGDNREFLFYPHLCRGYFYSSDSLFTRLSERGSHPCAITRKVGNGELTLVSTPLLFTNYGMLDGNNTDYLFRLLSRLKGAPIIRSEAYTTRWKEVEETPFRYLLSQRPLRWGLYLTMIVLVLFMIFTARRQQRVIPVVRRPANKTLEFVALIGTLYFQRKDHRDLVCKKFVYFAETLRRTIQIDIEGGEGDYELARRIAQKTGVNEDGVYRLLVDIRPVIKDGAQVSEESLAHFIEDMNEIINHI